MKSQNIILDIDHTLLHAIDLNNKNSLSYLKKLQPNFDEYVKQHPDDFLLKNIKTYHPQLMDDKYLIFYRPGLQQFLDTLLSKYNVMIWTAGTQPYARFVVENILSPLKVGLNVEICVKVINTRNNTQKYQLQDTLPIPSNINKIKGSNYVYIKASITSIHKSGKKFKIQTNNKNITFSRYINRKYIRPINRKFQIVFSDPECNKSMNKYNHIKKLSYVYSFVDKINKFPKFQKLNYNKHNTIIIDDNPDVIEDQTKNSIHIDQFNIRTDIKGVKDKYFQKIFSKINKKMRIIK